MSEWRCPSTASRTNAEAEQSAQREPGTIILKRKELQVCTVDQSSCLVFLFSSSEEEQVCASHDYRTVAPYDIIVHLQGARVSAVLPGALAIFHRAICCRELLSLRSTPSIQNVHMHAYRSSFVGNKKLSPQGGAATRDRTTHDYGRAGYLRFG